MKFATYPCTKPSGVEWLGDVPEHWDVNRLRWVGEAIIGLTYSPTDVVSEGEGALVLRSSNIQGGRIVLDDNVFVSAEIPQKLRTKVNDIVICTRNGSRDLVGKTGKISERESGLTFGAFTAVFRSSANDYMFYVFNSGLFSFQAGLYQTSTIFQLTNGTINTFQIPLPPPDEQRAIAAFLDQETGRVDRLVAKKQELIERLKEKRTALISRTVTRGLRNQDIQLMRLKRLLDCIDTGFTPDSYSYPAQVDQQGVLKSGCVNGGVFDPNENKLLADDVDPPASLEVNVGDILMSRASGSSELIGSVAQVREQPVAKLYLSDKTFRLRVNKSNCDGAFLVVAMGSSFLRSQLSQIISGAQGLAKNIAQSDMRELLVPTPPLPEQAAIAAYLDEETAKHNALVRKVEEAVERLQEYRTALITAAVTGKIDVRMASKP